MTWLAFAWFLSVGTLKGSTLLGNSYVVTPPNSSEITIGAKLQAFNDHLEVGGSVKTSQSLDTLGVYNPFLANYGAFARVKYGPVSLVVVHHCIHPVVNDNPAATFPLQEAYTTVSIELRGTTKLF